MKPLVERLMVAAREWKSSDVPELSELLAEAASALPPDGMVAVKAAYDQCAQIAWKFRSGIEAYIADSDTSGSHMPPDNEQIAEAIEWARDKALAASSPAKEEPTQFPKLSHVPAHKPTCANVQLASTYEDKCDCGAEPVKEVAEPSPSAIAAFGSGNLIVDTGTVKGVPAVFIKPAHAAGTIGELAPPEEQQPLDRLSPGEFFMTFPTEEQAKRVASALVAEPSPSGERRVLNYERAKGSTFEEMRANLSEALYNQGDTILIWANEGDLCLIDFALYTHPAPSSVIEALYPFAVAAAKYAEWRDDEDIDHAGGLLVGDLRRANAALALQAKQKGNPDEERG